MEDQTTPKGKRTVRRTVRGSLIGYIGRVQWANLGEAFCPYAEAKAAAFLAGDDE